MIEPLADHDLLLVAAGHRRSERAAARRLDRQVVDLLVGALRLLAPRQQEPVRQPVVDRQVEVEPDRQIEVEPLVAAALGRHRDAERDRLPFIANVDRLPLPQRLARGLWIAAENAHCKFAAPRADQPVKPDHLAAPHRDRNVLEALAREVPRFQQHLAERHRLLVIDLIERAVDHHRDQLGFVGVADIARGDQIAVAQHRYPVCQFEHFLEPVADVDDGNALVAQPADQRKQLRRLLPGQIGGRLVEDQELRAAQRCARRCHQLLLADRQVAQRRVCRNIEPHVFEDALRLARHLALPQEAEFYLLVAKENIGGHRQMPAQHHLLVHRVDAVVDRFLRRIEIDWLAIPVDFARAAPDDPGQQLDQCRFAGAVFTDDGVDLVKVEGQRRRLQRQHRRIVLCEVAEFEDGAGTAGARIRRYSHGFPLPG